jgi:NAD(P)-dependent dehydrogenase (short-subunit alcohol dehydrogenase family)
MLSRLTSPTTGAPLTTWFITGTSSGLGRQLTEQLLARGDRVAATLRRSDALDALRSTAGKQLRTYPLDVTDGGQVREMVDRAFVELGTIDVVVNNAAYALFAAVEEPSDEQIERIIDTNLMGSMRVIRAALPHLREQGHGRIVQISTAGGQTTYPNFSYYHASKWGIEGFCETIATEIRPLGIEMTIVEPGATPTGFSAAKETAPIMLEYDATPAGDVRRALGSGTFAAPNEAAKTAAAIIDAATETPARLRVPLGIDTYRDVRASYLARLQEHDAQRDRALSVAHQET